MPPDARAGAVSPAVARAAVAWLLALDEAPEGAPGADRMRARWRDWLAADPAHAAAWDRIAAMDERLRDTPSAAALHALAPPGAGRRRAAVRLAVLLAAGTGALLAARETAPWQALAADLATATGERRRTVLADGTRLQLGTASAVDLRYGATERRIVLRRGEVLVDSAPDASRPLRVQTAEGTVRAIGTRFTVRQQEGRTAVAVLDGAVELQPRGAPAPPPVLQAGQAADFSATQASPATALREGAAAWAEGMLVADDMALPDFLAELGRYRPGVLRCAPGAAGLRVSGTYPLDDTDRVLAALTRSLPVEVHSRSPWWVTVARRAD
ncbi:FecR domain-containing protein [Acidovorax sp. GBBC 3334]|uniref:FecR domain-containing protein n=1 Tax=Acidovorax sp. GBBC 3334 TaxID=2940496 RepID=UPI002302A205|nr:FecR domain-containing protein [Acidovorax sp. GBBC 3334]MDA8455770.1 FecR domain-containing protein [Acidovorax sp. GBBC 3334]